MAQKASTRKLMKVKQSEVDVPGSLVDLTVGMGGWTRTSRNNSSEWDHQRGEISGPTQTGSVAIQVLMKLKVNGSQFLATNKNLLQQRTFVSNAVEK